MKDFVSPDIEVPEIGKIKTKLLPGITINYTQHIYPITTTTAEQSPEVQTCANYWPLNGPVTSII